MGILAPLTIKKGKTFSCHFTLENPIDESDFDPTGWSARAQIRDYPTGEILHEWLPPNIVLELGKISIRVVPSTSELWGWIIGYYDIEIEHPDGTVAEIARGPIYSPQEITIS